MNARHLVATAILGLAAAGCGGTTPSVTKADDAPSSASPSASPSPSTKETATCQPLAQEYVDRFTTIDQRAKAGTLDIDVLRRNATAVAKLAGRIDSVCSPGLSKAAAMANYQTALAVGQLTACESRPSVCKKTQSQAGDSIIAAVAEAKKIDRLLHPA